MVSRRPLARSPQRFGADVHRMYFVDLVGAALGCLATIPLLSLLGGPCCLVACAGIATFAALVFVFGMVMNLGLAPFQFQFHSTVADHYAYLAMLGPALAVAWIASKITSRRSAAAAYAWECCRRSD